MANDRQAAGSEGGVASGSTVAWTDVNWSPLPDRGSSDDSWAMAAWRRICHEPALLFSSAYVLVGFLGLWSSWWFYQGFDIAILDYLQASDYLVAGLRDPACLVIFLGGVLLSVLISWPDTVQRRNPQQVQLLRDRHWWARLLFPRSRWTSWHGIGVHPFTGVSLMVAAFLLLGAALYMQGKGEQLRVGKAGMPLTVHLVGEREPLPGQARLLGTSSAFVYLWWPAQQRAEVVPVTSIRQLQTQRRSPAMGLQAPLPGTRRAVSPSAKKVPASQPVRAQGDGQGTMPATPPRP